ncbi:MAG: sulfatase-like hydrolase/transferase [Candidatus Cryptobacteroides sp.]
MSHKTLKPLHLLAGAGAVVSLAGCREEVKPNIVFFFADDIGTECFGCYGGAEYQTPNIDSLARVGIQYMNMNAQPLSSPSRVQLLTGQYNDRNYSAFGYINDDERIFPQLASQAGYRTAIVGKWQLGRDRSMISRMGFDESYCSQVELYRETRSATQTDRYANSIWDVNGKTYDFALYGPDSMEDYAFDFIDRKAAAGEPFLLYYTEPLVHTPHVSTPDGEEWDLDYGSRFTAAQDTSYFRGMVAYMDKQVGNMVRHLKDRGLWENTVFFFCADNGTSTRIVSKQQDGSRERGGKGEANYFATHVPLIVCWGDKVNPRQVEHLVDLTDFLPTFADIMGVRVPDDWTVDGVSLYPELLGGEPAKKDLVLVHFNPLWPTTPSPKASRYAMNDTYAYFWDGRIYNYREDPRFTSPVMYENASDELKAAVCALKERVEDRTSPYSYGTDFRPDAPGAPRRGNYKTFYDWAPPQNPF